MVQILTALNIVVFLSPKVGKVSKVRKFFKSEIIRRGVWKVWSPKSESKKRSAAGGCHGEALEPCGVACTPCIYVIALALCLCAHGSSASPWQPFFHSTFRISPPLLELAPTKAEKSFGLPDFT